MFKKIKNFIASIFFKKKEIKVKPPSHPTEKELSERNKNIKQIYKDKQKVSGSFVCPTCSINTTKVVTCKKCGAKGCDLCFTYDAAEQGFFCEDCW
jgi:hypothetical protein